MFRDRMADDDDIKLGGGAINQVRRRGSTVRRPAGFWTASVHDLLRYMAAIGFPAPRPVGVDENGEILVFIEGEQLYTPGSAVFPDDDALVELGRLLRRYHDTIAGFDPPAASVWQTLPATAPATELICHNDFAPWNVLRTPHGQLVLIDWDLAAPGTRLWDIAYAAWVCVPLWNDDDVAARGLAPMDARGPRLRSFCDAYGLGSAERARLLDTVGDRQLAALEQARVWAAEGRPGWRAQWSLPEPWRHGRGYLREIAFLEAHRDEWNHALAASPP